MPTRGVTDANYASGGTRTGVMVLGMVLRLADPSNMHNASGTVNHGDPRAAYNAIGAGFRGKREQKPGNIAVDHVERSQTPSMQNKALNHDSAAVADGRSAQNRLIASLPGENVSLGRGLPC